MRTQRRKNKRMQGVDTMITEANNSELETRNTRQDTHTKTHTHTRTQRHTHTHTNTQTHTDTRTHGHKDTRGWYQRQIIPDS